MITLFYLSFVSILLFIIIRKYKKYNIIMKKYNEMIKYNITVKQISNLLDL